MKDKLISALISIVVGVLNFIFVKYVLKFPLYSDMLNFIFSSLLALRIYCDFTGPLINMTPEQISQMRDDISMLSASDSERAIYNQLKRNNKR